MVQLNLQINIPYQFNGQLKLLSYVKKEIFYLLLEGQAQVE